MIEGWALKATMFSYLGIMIGAAWIAGNAKTEQEMTAVRLAYHGSWIGLAICILMRFAEIERM